MKIRVSNAALGGAAVAFLVLAAALFVLGIGHAHPARYGIHLKPAHSAVYHRPAANARTA